MTGRLIKWHQNEAKNNLAAFDKRTAHWTPQLGPSISTNYGKYSTIQLFNCGRPMTKASFYVQCGRKKRRFCFIEITRAKTFGQTADTYFLHVVRDKLEWFDIEFWKAPRVVEKSSDNNQTCSLSPLLPPLSPPPSEATSHACLS